MGIVTLLSDFGSADGYVGAIKGVILSRARQARIVDLTHDIPAQDIRFGAWALREASSTFPQGTIHLAVVDPGVGSARHPLLLRAAERFFVGPDNGVLTLAAHDADQGWVLDRAQWFCRDVSATFHGRDIFASVAGHLAAGVSPDRVGTPIDCWERLVEPLTRSSESVISGEVIHIDHFGNLVTNATRNLLETADNGALREKWQVKIAGQVIGPVHWTFADVAPQAWVAYIGSSERVEIGVREGNAAQQGGFGLGTEVSLCRAE